MTWKNHYLPPDSVLWQGRADLPAAVCFFQIIQILDLLNESLPKIKYPTFALVGFRCDEGIRRNKGRLGAAEGAIALRQALAKLPIQKQNITLLDVGDIVCLDGDLEAAQKALAEVITPLLQNDITPIVIGGGHELAWGHYQGIEAAFPNKNLGIINFDAHFDMREVLLENKGSSGTSFLQIAKSHQMKAKRLDYNCIGIQQAANTRQLFEIAKNNHTKIIFADELHLDQQEKCVDFIDRVIDENEMVYVSLCLDVFASAFAPGVSAIQPLGLFPWHIIPLVRQLAASGKVVSYDIAELSPPHDVDQCTAKLAAHLVYEMIHHHDEEPRTW